MAKKSMLKAKRSAKEDQKPTALEALLQTLTKAKEEAIAPQRKKARVTKQEQPQTADAEAAAESETDQEEMDQMREGTEEKSEANWALMSQSQRHTWSRTKKRHHAKK